MNKRGHEKFEILNFWILKVKIKITYQKKVKIKINIPRCRGRGEIKNWWNMRVSNFHYSEKLWKLKIEWLIFLPQVFIKINLSTIIYWTMDDLKNPRELVQ